MTSSEKNKRKKLLVDCFGGKCPCGESHLPCLHFHHIDPATKKNAISKMISGNWGNLIAEVKKCTLLCANCHTKVHDCIYTLPFTTFDSAILEASEFEIQWAAKQAKTIGELTCLESLAIYHDRIPYRKNRIWFDPTDSSGW